jgi:hypothetical protein
MNKCLNCGNFIPDDAKVCPFCGVNLKENINLNQQLPQQGYQFPQQQTYSQDISYQQQLYQQDISYQQQPYPQDISYQQQSNLQNISYQQPYQQQLPNQDPYSFQQFPYQQQSQQVPFNQGVPSFQQQPSVNYPQSNNIPMILGFSSIALGVIACPANFLAICGIFFSILGLAVGIFGFIKSVDNNDKIINGIGVGISLIMLGLSCLNSIFGVLLRIYR